MSNAELQQLARDEAFSMPIDEIDVSEGMVLTMSRKP